VELGNLRPQRHVQAQALRFHALEIRHAHAPMNFELLDVNAIDHDSLNFGAKRIGRRAQFSSRREWTRDSERLLGRKRSYNLLKARVAAQRIPVRVQTELTIAQIAGDACRDS
jgi:hypothetical protein